MFFNVYLFLVSYNYIGYNKKIPMFTEINIMNCLQTVTNHTYAISKRTYRSYAGRKPLFYTWLLMFMFHVV